MTVHKMKYLLTFGFRSKVKHPASSANRYCVTRIQFPKKLEPPNEQAERFREAARELGCNENEEKFDAALKKIAGHKIISVEPKAPKNVKRRLGVSRDGKKSK